MKNIGRNRAATALVLAALILVDYLQLIIPSLYQMVINGINTGKTTVTVEDPVSGATADITVIVYPQSVQALFNVIEIFTSMIYNFVEYLFSLIASYLPF